MPSWDNTARRNFGALIIQNDDAGVFEAWMQDAATRVSSYPEDEQIVFINAWNEWAEGCHLEPDLRNGRRFLEAARRVFGRGAEAPVVVASRPVEAVEAGASRVVATWGE